MQANLPHAVDTEVKIVLVLTLLKCDLFVFIYMYLNCIIIQLQNDKLSVTKGTFSISQQLDEI